MRRQFWLISGLAVAIVAATVPLLGFDSYLLYVIELVFIQATLLLAVNISVGQAGLVSLAHGSFFGAGAYASGILMTRYHWDWIVTLIPAVAVAAVAGLGLGLLTLRLSGPYFVIASMAVAELGLIVVQNGGTLTNGQLGVSDIPSPAYLETETARYLGALALLVIGTLFAWLLRRSRTGDRLLALRENEQLARTVGVDTTRARLVALVISAGLAGGAGAFLPVYVGYLSPTNLGEMVGFMALVALVIGGLGSLGGSILGAAVLVIIPEFFADLPYLQPMFLGAALILIIRFAPQGLWGTMSEGGRRLSGRAKPVSVETEML